MVGRARMQQNIREDEQFKSCVTSYVWRKKQKRAGKEKRKEKHESA